MASECRRAVDPARLQPPPEPPPVSPCLPPSSKRIPAKTKNRYPKHTSPVGLRTSAMVGRNEKPRPLCASPSPPAPLPLIGRGELLRVASECRRAVDPARLQPPPEPPPVSPCLPPSSKRIPAKTKNRYPKHTSPVGLRTSAMVGRNEKPRPLCASPSPPAPLPLIGRGELLRVASECRRAVDPARLQPPPEPPPVSPCLPPSSKRIPAETKNRYPKPSPVGLRSSATSPLTGSAYCLLSTVYCLLSTGFWILDSGFRLPPPPHPDEPAQQQTCYNTPFRTCL